jgi:hypothetical protein
MNYKVVPVEVSTFVGVTTKMLPDFFNAFPRHLRAHMASKWEYGYDTYGSRAALMWLYGELSSNYRKDVLVWIMDNYDDEQKFNFNEED